MGLFQSLIDTYDAMIGLADYTDGKFPLAPVAHVAKFADVEITIDGAGNFLGARQRVKKGNSKKGIAADPRIVIPVTEASLGRGSDKPYTPHYLCDELCFFDAGSPVSNNAFISQLEGFASYSGLAKAYAVLAYAVRGQVMLDMASQFGDGGFKPGWTACFVVDGIGNDSGPCWTDRSLMDALSAYHIERLGNEGRERSICTMTGRLDLMAQSHMKGAVPLAGNAKLVSSNSTDNNRYTYKGRFSEAAQSVRIGYLASQKAHNALAWLIGRQGLYFGNRVAVCWQPEGRRCAQPADPLIAALQDGMPAASPSDYRARLRDALTGWRVDMPDSGSVAVAVFEAPSKGTLANTYFGSYGCGEYLSRLAEWDERCCAGGFTVPLRDLVKYAYGTYDGSFFSFSDRQKGMQAKYTQRLVMARINGGSLPGDVKDRLVANASKLAAVKQRSVRDYLLKTACGAVRKYRYDTNKEEWDMKLDTGCTDRSYLFGRLLAVADRIENQALWRKQQKGDDTSARATAAMRMQQAFVQRPMSAWKTVRGLVEPYLKQLSPGSRNYYEDLIMEITGLFDTRDLNKPLADTYLLGFYEQRAALRYDRAADGGGADDGNGGSPETGVEI